MASTKTRRPRGTATDVIGLYVTVAPDVKAKLDTIVAATGRAQWHVLETLIHDTEIDDDGRPLGWAVLNDDQQELPLKSA